MKQDLLNSPTDGNMQYAGSMMPDRNNGNTPRYSAAPDVASTPAKKKCGCSSQRPMSADNNVMPQTGNYYMDRGRSASPPVSSPNQVSSALYNNRNDTRPAQMNNQSIMQQYASASSSNQMRLPQNTLPNIK